MKPTTLLIAWIVANLRTLIVRQQVGGEGVAEAETLSPEPALAK
jgi:hypothetical protein